jgi:hypothetical protein
MNNKPTTSSTQTISELVPLFVYNKNLKGLIATSNDIRVYLITVYNNTPSLFGDSELTSTLGSCRSMLSEIGKKENTRIKGIKKIVMNGVTGFYTDEANLIKCIFSNQIKGIEKERSNFIHTDTQYMLCDIFSQKGYKFFIPRGDRDKKNSLGFNFNDTYGESISEIYDSVGQNIDFVLMNSDNKVVALFEIEESTGVTSGLNRMIKFKTDSKLKNVKSFVVSSQKAYKTKFEKESKSGVYKPLNSKFLEFNLIQDIFESEERNVNFV